MIKEDFPTPPFFRNLISVDKYDKLIDVRQKMFSKRALIVF